MKEISIDFHLFDPESFASCLDWLYVDGVFECAFLFESDFRNAKVLRDYLGKIFQIVGLSSLWKGRFILIADELNNNAIEYGSLAGEINIMRIKISQTDVSTEVLLEVEDTWHGAAAKSAQMMEELRTKKLTEGFQDHTSIRGRGLFLIITRLVDSLYFADSEKWGLLIWVKKSIQKEP